MVTQKLNINGSKKVSFLKMTALMLFCIAMLCACVKDGENGKDGTNGKDGKDGVAGTNGTNGTNGADGKDGKDGKDGAQGAQGIPGNAGTMMYVWENVTVTGGYTSFVFFLEFDVSVDMNKSLIYAYYSDDADFNPIPHPFILGGYAANFSLGTTSFGARISVHLTNANGTAYSTSVTWNDFRVVVVTIPDGNIFTKSSVNNYPVDWSNYSEVAGYFGLPE
jgi:hypothetical protein